jgi:glycerate kinase
MVASSNGEIKYTRVCGPLKHIVDAAYGVLWDQKTVVIEMAQASGLSLLKGEWEELRTTYSKSK